MNAVRCPPADQPVTMMGPVIPCSALFALSQSNAVRTSFCDLSQTRFRGQRISRQGSRPAARQRTFCEEGKYFLAVALPITPMNVDEAGCLRIVAGIEVPLRPLS